ncbi:alpha/beta hydrolase [Frigoribacterium sp. NPDC087798]|uniref:alpha/beta hydrolase n=1 Tax=Frigoribacterium sp. NPDC087798 TaxID=3363993 RepID=UPI00381B0DE7
MDWLLSVPLLSTTMLLAVDVVAALVAVGLLVRPRTRRTWWRWIALAVLLGAGLGALATWWLGDVRDVLGLSPTWVDRLWVAAVVAGVAVVVVNLFRTRWWRKLVAVLGVLVFALAGGLALNRDGSVYQNLSQALGRDEVPALPATAAAPPSAAPGSTDFDPTLWSTWKAPVDLPAVGRYGSVAISGAVSHFPARDAVVYLPPAALVADAPALPVMIMLSGQPAEPSSVITAGHLVETLNAFAAKDHGLAPIVVVPDQLSADAHNPMCVDGALGNSATYITTDVVDYMTSHFHVATGPRAWAIGGFSQGGTCSIQFASARPDLFSTFIDVSGELGPSIGDEKTTIDQGFAGNRAAYEAAQPLAIMAAHGPYADTAAFFAVGATDGRYGQIMTANSAAAAKAGMTVTRYVSPGSGHDWTTATNGFAHGIGQFYPRLGLSATVQTP